jgi:hypothetical protein
MSSAADLTIELLVENFIQPGAGLKQLPDFVQDSDFIFDSLFLPDIVDIPDIPDITLSLVPMVRTYQSDNAM